MGKSRRRHKIFGHTAASSEKQDKQHCNRATRRRVHMRLNSGDYDTPLPLQREVMNPYTMDKDGKAYWPDAEAEDMRK